MKSRPARLERYTNRHFEELMNSWHVQMSGKTALCQLYYYLSTLEVSPSLQWMNACKDKFNALFASQSLGLKVQSSLNLQQTDEFEFLVVEKDSPTRLSNWIHLYRETRMNAALKELELLSHVGLSHQDKLRVLEGVKITYNPLTDELDPVFIGPGTELMKVLGVGTPFDLPAGRLTMRW